MLYLMLKTFVLQYSILFQIVNEKNVMFDHMLIRSLDLNYSLDNNYKIILLLNSKNLLIYVIHNFN